MTNSPDRQDAVDAPLPDRDPGDEEAAGPDAAAPSGPPAGAPDDQDTGGPDTQLAPQKD
jgi:hypothetical protein